MTTYPSRAFTASRSRTAIGRSWYSSITGTRNFNRRKATSREGLPRTEATSKGIVFKTKTKARSNSNLKGARENVGRLSRGKPRNLTINDVPTVLLPLSRPVPNEQAQGRNSKVNRLVQVESKEWCAMRLTKAQYTNTCDPLNSKFEIQSGGSTRDNAKCYEA